MKHLLFLLLLANWSLLYSQESKILKDTINKPERLISTILIDSAKLHKYREINASGVILYENPSVTFDNNSFLSAIPLTRIRDNSPAILTLNGVPLSQTILPINQFNIGKIEISKTSFNAGTNFLNGSVNLSTIKPHFNTPLKVSYEGGLNIGRYAPTTMSLNEGVSLSNNVSIEKGKEKSATRISFSNSTSGLGNFEGGNYYLLLNTINLDKTNLVSPNILINTSISLTQGTYLTNYIPYYDEGIESSSENKKSYSYMVFGNVAMNYKVTDLLHLNINTGTMFSKLGIGYSDNPRISSSFYSDPKNCTPFYADFSATRKTKLNSKNVLITTLGYNFLSYQSNQASPFSSYKARSLYGSINYSFLNVINIKGSLCNEFYGDVYPNLDYFLVSAVEFQFDVYKLLIKNPTSSSIMLYANYNTSQKESDFINLTNKFEGGLDISILSNRLGLNICYFKYDSRINYSAIYQKPWGAYPPPPIYGRFDKGVEIQNSIKIIETKNTNWLIKNNFAWYNSNAKPDEWHEEFLSLLKSHLPKYKLGFVSDLTFKNFSFGLIIERLKDQPTNIFPLELGDPGKEVTDIFAIRQINLMYTKNNLNLKRIKSYSISLFAKNFNLFAKPSEYKNIRPIYFDQIFGISCSRMIGINLQMTF